MRTPHIVTVVTKALIEEAQEGLQPSACQLRFARRYTADRHLVASTRPSSCFKAENRNSKRKSLRRPTSY